MSHNALRVVLTCDWFLKYACWQAAGLSQAGAQVLLLCRSHAHEFDGDEVERQAALAVAHEAGVAVVEIPGRLSDPRALLALARLRRRLVSFRPEIVHAHDGADPRALLLLAGVATVLTLHDPVFHPGQPVPEARKRWFLHGAREAWLRRARAIIVHSERLRDEVVLRPGQRCEVIAHGIDAAREPLAPPSEPAVAFFGRLAPYKGLDVLAQAMPHVWAERPEVRLRVAGEGDSDLPLHDPRAEIRREYLPERETREFFAGASLAVLPYTQASQSGAGSLAIGYGVPVIVSRLGGLPDLALEESYVVAPGDPRELAAAILRHIDDGIEIRRRVLADVAGPRGWSAVARDSLRLYAGVLGRP